MEIPLQDGDFPTPPPQTMWKFESELLKRPHGSWPETTQGKDSGMKDLLSIDLKSQIIQRSETSGETRYHATVEYAQKPVKILKEQSTPTGMRAHCTKEWTRRWIPMVCMNVCSAETTGTM